MNKMKKITFFIFLAVSVILILFLLWYNSLPNLSITVRDSRYSFFSYEINGTLYFTRSNGVYKIEEGKKAEHIVDTNGKEVSIYISSQNETIYIVDYTSNIVINQYDLNGNINNVPLLLSSDDFKFYKADGNVLIGKKESSINTCKVIGYDVENDLQSSTIDAIEYDDNQVSFCIREGEILNYSFKSTSSDFIGVSSSQIAYMDKFYHPEIYIINFLNSTETKIELYNYIQNGYYVFGCLNDNTISAIVTDTSGFFFDKINVEGNTSTLKYHNYDSCIFIDSKSGEIKYQHKFSRFERIIYIDGDKVITYFKGKYLTYSLFDWKVIDTKSAPEIKNGGSYTFEICGNYIFVFDDNSGELLNTIDIT